MSTVSPGVARAAGCAHARQIGELPACSAHASWPGITLIIFKSYSVILRSPIVLQRRRPWFP